MEFNPIKRIKLHVELWKNDKRFIKNSNEFNALSSAFRDIYNDGKCPSDDGTIKALEVIEQKEQAIVRDNDAIIARDDEIWKQLYGGLI